MSPHLREYASMGDIQEEFIFWRELMKQREYVGVDIGKKTLDVGYEYIDSKGRKKVRKRKFTNTFEGFKKLEDFGNRNVGEGVSIHFIMEATGSYHEEVAPYLYAQGHRVSVVNPARVKAFGQSMGVRTKTDEKDPLVLVQFGKALNPDPWEPPSEEYRMLLIFYRAIEMRKKQRTVFINRIEALRAAKNSPEVIIEEDIALLERVEESIGRIEKEIRLHLDIHLKVKKEVELLETIDGIGWITSILLVAVMAGGSRFKSAREAASYAGLSVRENQSGNFCGRSRLSKQGPPEIRKALYWPAITATRFNPDVIDLYNRLIKRGKCKMAAIGAAMRKLVHIAFGVLKHNTKYTSQVG